MGHVDFKKAHPPLLFVCGSRDQIVPASLNVKNSNAFVRHDKATNSTTALATFDGMTHLIIAEPGWEAVLAACVDFIREHVPPLAT